MKLTGAQILIEELIRQGTEVLFGYPGGTVVDIYDALYYRSERIKHVLTAHEQGAAHGADGYARATGRPGVVIATSGPGATNLVTGIACAYMDSIPMVIITGNVSTAAMGMDGFQDINIVNVTQSIVKHSYFLTDVRQVEETVKEAFTMATTGRPGPILIDIPKNVQKAQWKYPVGGPETFLDWKLPSFVAEGEYEKAVELLTECSRPYIYCGGGVVTAGASQEVMELARKLDAPIGCSLMGLSAIPRSFEGNLGMSGMHGRYAASMAQAEADLILAIGARFSDRATNDVGEYVKGRTVIHIDIDPTELDKNFYSQLSMCGDVKEVAGKLLGMCPARKNPKWRRHIEACRQEEARLGLAPTPIPALPSNPAPIPAPAPAEAMQGADEPLSPRNIIAEVSAVCERDTVVATDVGQHQMWVAQYYPFERPRTLITSGGLGAMGFGLGAAIGASLGKGGARTVLFTGDGSFGMNLTELATAVSQKLPIVIVLMNNGVLGMVRQLQNVFCQGRYSQVAPERKTDFVKLAEAFGAAGARASTREELHRILAELPKQQEGPFLIDCTISAEHQVAPMIPPGGSVKNIILK